MAAPEEEYVVGIGAVDDVGQLLRLSAQEDVGQVGGAREVAEAVVDDGPLSHVGIDQSVGRALHAAALQIDLAGEGVAGVVGQVVLNDEDDVVVVVAMLLQQLVHGQGISLMAVVLPCGAGTDDHGPPLAQVGQLAADVVSGSRVEGVDDGLPVPQRISGNSRSAASR